MMKMYDDDAEMMLLMTGNEDYFDDDDDHHGDGVVISIFQFLLDMCIELFSTYFPCSTALWKLLRTNLTERLRFQNQGGN